MRESPSDSAAGAAETPLGQSAVKAISNVCFSFFVLSVLVFTVIAITYQPPNPWFDSPRAITHSLSATVPNATFRTDDSLLPTGEDLVALPPSASAASSSIALIPNPASISESSSGCDAGAPINCSDPRALAAIQRFNARVFKRSILILGYATPVPGPAPGECDAAWRFRNRREKSWRRYLDYRRFRLAPADNCTLEVVSTGKFRSGTNTARPRQRPRSAAPAPEIVAESEINDTIPTVGDSAFRKSKYL